MKIILLEKSRIQYGKHSFPWHVHPDHFTFSFVTEGRAILETPQQRFLVRPGDLIFIPAGLPHRTQVADYFTYEIIRFRLVNASGYLYAHPFYRFTEDHQIRRFREWFDSLQCSSTGQRQIDLRQMPVFFQQFFQCHQNGRQLNDPAILRSVSYLHQHFDSRLRIDDLSKISFRSASHFQRTFKQQMGISPMRYLLGLKVDKAKELMQQDLSLSAIAQAAGFFDQSHFNRYFKQFSGLNPQVYRQLLVE